MDGIAPITFDAVRKILKQRPDAFLRRMKKGNSQNLLWSKTPMCCPQFRTTRSHIWHTSRWERAGPSNNNQYILKNTQVFYPVQWCIIYLLFPLSNFPSSEQWNAQSKHSLPQNWEELSMLNFWDFQTKPQTLILIYSFIYIQPFLHEFKKANMGASIHFVFPLKKNTRKSYEPKTTFHVQKLTWI